MIKSTFYLLLTAFFALSFVTNDGSGKSGSGLDDAVNLSPDYLIVNPNYEENFHGIDSYTTEELVHLIDSIFDADSVPQALLFELQVQLAHLENRDTTPIENLSEYPANQFYQDWNTVITNPYNRSTHTIDSSFVTELVNPLLGQKYCAPVKSVKNTITSNFGFRDGRAHNGIDIDLITGDSVMSVFDGVVRISRRHGGYGNVIVVRHHNGLETTYAHLSKRKVEVGDPVFAGQLIGLGGNTGKSTGSHLHFEVRFVGHPINPKSIINFKSHCLLSDSVTIKPTSYGYAVFPHGKEFHTIEKGDYLYKICALYGISLQQVCEWNGIRRNSTLRVGQKLRIEPYQPAPLTALKQ